MSRPGSSLLTKLAKLGKGAEATLYLGRHTLEIRVVELLHGEGLIIARCLEERGQRDLRPIKKDELTIRASQVNFYRIKEKH